MYDFTYICNDSCSFKANQSSKGTNNHALRVCTSDPSMKAISFQLTFKSGITSNKKQTQDLKHRESHSMDNLVWFSKKSRLVFLTKINSYLISNMWHFCIKNNTKWNERLRSLANSKSAIFSK